MTVYFHGNFGLNRERMAKILYKALRNPEARDKNLAKPFGYNAPFTARYRSWLHKTGMVKLGQRTCLAGKSRRSYSGRAAV